MDEINVVRKGSRTWLWIIGLIVLAAIIWAIVALSSHRNPTPASQLQPASPHGGTPAVVERLARL